MPFIIGVSCVQQSHAGNDEDGKINGINNRSNVFSNTAIIRMYIALHFIAEYLWHSHLRSQRSKIRNSAKIFVPFDHTHHESCAKVERAVMYYWIQMHGSWIV